MPSQRSGPFLSINPLLEDQAVPGLPHFPLQNDNTYPSLPNLPVGICETLRSAEGWGALVHQGGEYSEQEPHALHPRGGSSPSGDWATEELDDLYAETCEKGDAQDCWNGLATAPLLMGTL